jgi:hypothetical protein
MHEALSCDTAVAVADMIALLRDHDGVERPGERQELPPSPRRCRPS